MDGTANELDPQLGLDALNAVTIGIACPFQESLGWNAVLGSVQRFQPSSPPDCSYNVSILDHRSGGKPFAL